MARKIPKVVRRRLVVLGTLSVIAIGYFFGTVINYTYSYIQLSREVNQLNNTLANLQQENVHLRAEIEKLNDPEYIARFARENFLYSVAGEYVIRMDNRREVEEESIETDNRILYVAIGGSVSFMAIFFFIIRSKK